MRFKDLIWIFKNLRHNKIAFNIYLKNIDNIEIGKNCKILRGCELDASGNGKIIIHNNVTLNPYVFLQANKGFIEIGENSEINNFTIINSGAKIMIGNNVLIGPKVNIISYTHNYKDSNILIRKQNAPTKKILIEDDVWIGANTTILYGVKIGKGAVVGANSLVTKDIEPYTINVGSPTKTIGKRK